MRRGPARIRRLGHAWLQAILHGFRPGGAQTGNTAHGQRKAQSNRAGHDSDPTRQSGTSAFSGVVRQPRRNVDG
ncbi:hypothetical protein D187_006892 [Cystobacter fuscus DSM 2262]|uniref:Uncharacterized protein n=1 Tax=Cystobacter fuscus (strain ATCC 25194 / DSM 2262 / NBRC 100088 / M29) TaxID=1242864 RepID=S9QL07_CYSF2|nr:hypothetical protein D187_006892 [Cystobacter fuscus DSM 2262]